MAIATFDRSERPGVTIGQVHAVGIVLAGKWRLVDSTCPHRGGPLHLGEVDPTSGVVTCPWHRISMHCVRLKPVVYPTVRVRDRVSVICVGECKIKPINVSNL